jgi:hypothetical protein
MGLGGKPISSDLVQEIVVGHSILSFKNGPKYVINEPIFHNFYLLYYDLHPVN